MKGLQHFSILWFIIFEVDAGLAPGARWAEVSNGLTASNPRVTTLAIDRAGSTLYVVTAGQGVFKSTDAGSTWRMLGAISGVLAVAIDPTSPSIVYAGTRHGVRRSSNGGETWTTAGQPDAPVYVLAVDPITPSTVYAAIADQLYKSTDSGATWTVLALRFSSIFGSSISVILLDPIGPSTIYTVGGGSALYKSTDAGESWNVVNDGHFSSSLRISSSNASILYAIRSESGLSRSTDGGTTWTSIAFGQPVQTIATDPSNAATLYASVAGPNLTGQAIYESTDAGKSWVLVNTTMPIAVSVTVDPADVSVVYAVSYKGDLFRSTDAGRNWNDTSARLRVFEIAVISGDPANPGTVYAGSAERLFKSLDRGANWNPVAAFQIAMGVPLPGVPPPSIPIPSAGGAAVRSLLIDYKNPGMLYAGTHRTDGCFFTDKNIFKSTDGGVTWSNSISPEGSGCITEGTLIMDPMDPNTLYLPEGDIFDGYWLSKSTDGGMTWRYTGLVADYFFRLAIDPRNPAILYAATDAGVLRSSDGGGRWNATGMTQGNATLLAIDPRDPRVLYAAGSRSLFKSIDSGDNWSSIGKELVDVLAGNLITALLIDPAQSDVLYLASSGYGVFKSSDGGSTWAAVNDGLAHLDVRVMALLRDDSISLFAGTPGGVFKLVEDRQ